jgi:uncharacterized repeat protein (TIGR01451 family)
LKARAAPAGPSGGAVQPDVGSRGAATADYVGAPRRLARALRACISLWRRACCAVAICGVASAASAQLPSAHARAELELATRVEKIVAAAGADKADARTRLVPAEDLSPGDELVITVTFLNTTQHALDGVRITQPIPPSMRYVEGSGVGPGSAVLYSVDGGATYGQPNELGVVTAEGVRRAATAADYTQVRWLLKAPLAAGARAFVRFRATVRALAETSAPGHAAP